MYPHCSLSARENTNAGRSGSAVDGRWQATRQTGSGRIVPKRSTATSSRAYGPGRSPVAGASAATDALLPGLEIDARVNHGIEDVADDLHQQAKQGEHIQGAEHHRIVAT